ncbi:MAG: gliding motility-associated C-terminal domain-containing protein [Chitinophagaceae bacterium]|nr:gliding motility-associated C-terminal domain-containing protein [Chitinophagaceae bacterium]
MLITLNSGTAYAQQPPAPDLTHPPVIFQNQTNLDHKLKPESDCSNGIDDNNNGLTDLNDFHCYFNSNAFLDVCTPGKIIWMSTNLGIHWVNLETNEQRLVMNLNGYRYDDLTWGSNGKLYGAEYWGNIVEIDPYTFQQTELSIPKGHYYSNGLTGDAAGNLFLSSFTTSQLSNILRYNPGTRQTEQVISLTEHGLTSAGDLSFIDGYLYVACLGNIIAKIDIYKKTLQKLPIINSPVTDGTYGMTYLGDGYLYISDNLDAIYRVDINTMEASLYTKFNLDNFFVLGFTSYYDLCNGPGCKAKLNITTDGFPPYCSNKGVVITANGRGITGESGYRWTLPDGSISTEKTLTATKKGTYYVRYHTMPDTCGVIDSIVLNIVEVPSVNLGNDTIVCADIPLKIFPKMNSDVSEFYWDDGSTELNRLVTSPGKYWLEGVNRCGVSADTIVVVSKTKAHVYLGSDTSICPYNSITIRNNERDDPHTTYTWSNGETGSSIEVNGPGLYRLQSSNACGTLEDEIVISGKDSCVCRPFHPKIDIGKDRWLCTNDTLMIANSLHADGFRYSWSSGSQDKSVVVKNPGTYVVDVSTYCGTVSDTIVIHQKIDDCGCFLYTPNAFSPNHDSRNDVFEVRSNCIIKGTIRIFNRWGGLVYTSDDLSKGWNGRVGNNIQPSGLYLYNVHYEYVNRPGKFFKKGTITLLH